MIENDDMASVVGNAMKSARIFAVAAFAVASTGGTYVWNLSQFIHDEKVHEAQQDKNMLALKRENSELKEGLKASRDLNLELVQLGIENVALLREMLVQTAKANRRANMRKQFAAQRTQEIELLVNLRKVD